MAYLFPLGFLIIGCLAYAHRADPPASLRQENGEVLLEIGDIVISNRGMRWGKEGYFTLDCEGNIFLRGKLLAHDEELGKSLAGCEK